jgi:hypothetical protein
MHLFVVLVPCILIAILGTDLLRAILDEGRLRMQSRKRRESVQRWIRDAQLSH